MVRLFAGSFEGAVLYDNPNYVSPNVQRREQRKGQTTYVEKQFAVKASNAKQARVTEILTEKMEDLVGKVRKLVRSKVQLSFFSRNSIFSTATTRKRLPRSLHKSRNVESARRRIREPSTLDPPDYHLSIVVLLIRYQCCSPFLFVDFEFYQLFRFFSIKLLI